jgi:hypothetical protein
MGRGRERTSLKAPRECRAQDQTIHKYGLLEPGKAARGPAAGMANERGVGEKMRAGEREAHLDAKEEGGQAYGDGHHDPAALELLRHVIQI